MELSEALERIRTGAARSRPLFVLGLVGVVAGFVFFTFYINQLRLEAERQRDGWHREAISWRQTAKSLEQRIAAARIALRTGNLAVTDRWLRGAVAEAQQLAEATIPAAATPPAEAPSPQTPAPQQAPAPGPETNSAAPRQIPLFSLPPAGERSRIVYIQFAGRIRRETIIGLNQSLRRSGWRVPGPSGERITSADGLSVVKFTSEQDREPADSLAAAVTSTSISRRAVSAQQVPNIPPGTLEIWISN